MISTMLKENGLKQIDLADALGFREASFSRKLRAPAGSWKIEECRATAAWFSKKLGREVTVEQLFPVEASA